MKKALGNARRPVHYLAILPSRFEQVIQGLGTAGLAKDARSLSKNRSGAT